jgi:hypothetical protein
MSRRPRFSVPKVPDCGKTCYIIHMTDLFAWLTKYEAIAVWLEGVALVAIFIWDRVDANRDHDETIEQIKLAQDQIKAMQNAERAWVMTDLDWPKSENLKVVHTTSRQGEGPQIEQTVVSVMLHCKNEGRSPAFVDKIQAYGEIVNSFRDVTSTGGHEGREIIPIGAMAPGNSSVRIIQITCPGHLKDDQLFSIFVLVEYRDIFGQKRITTCGYTVMDYNLYRQDMLPDRNRHT